MVQVVAKQHVYSSKLFKAEVESGISIDELLPNARSTVRVMIDGVIIPNEDWKKIILLDKNLVTIFEVPGDNNFGRMLGQLFVAWAFYYTGGLAASYISGSSWLAEFGRFAVQAAFTAVGVNVGFRLFGLKDQPQADAIGSKPSITGTANQMNPFGPIPKLYGTFKYFPPLAASWYTELSGNDQYFRMLLCLGYGKLSIGGIIPSVGSPITEQSSIPLGTIELGDTDISLFENVEFEIGYVDDITLYTNDISEIVPNISFAFDVNDPPEDTWISEGTSFTQSTGDNTNEISLDLSFPNGLWCINKEGKTRKAIVDFLIEYKPSSSGSFINAPISAVVDASEDFTVPSSPYQITIAHNSEFHSNSKVLDRTTGFIIPPGNYTVVNGLYTFQSNVSGHDITIDYRYTFDGGIRFSGPTKDTIRRNIRWKVDQGDYDVRITRVQTWLDDAEGVYTDCIWTALRTIRSTPAWDGLDNVILAAFRIKATDQVNGLVDQISVLASSVLQVWNGSTFSDEVSNNPAWCYYDALTGPQVKRPVPQSRISLEDLLSWADWCDINDVTYNWVHDTDETILQRIKEIATTGHASYAIKDGQYTVVRDTIQSTPIQVISPRNASGFRSDREYRLLPHALRVQFIDTNSWEASEIISYRDGFDKDSSSIFEQLVTQGITDPSQAWKLGQYVLRSSVLRPEQFHVTMDYENLVATRGDLVRLAYDVIQVGLKWGRIKSIVRDGNDDITSITLDEEFVVETGKDYAFRIRHQTGTQTIRQLTNPGSGLYVTMSLQSPFDDSSDLVNVGDLVLFGEFGIESLDAKITAIEYSSNFVATLTLVDAAASIYDLDAPPVYDANISIPGDLTKIAPPIPEVVNIISDESVLIRDISGFLKASLLVSYKFTSINIIPIEFIEIRYKVVGSDKWLYVRDISSKGFIRVQDVEELSDVEFQLRSISAYNVPSQWSSEQSTTIIGKSSRPQDVINFTVAARNYRSYMSWMLNPDPDISYYEIRKGTDWSTAEFVAQVSARTSNYSGDLLSAGLSSFLIKAFDSAAVTNESMNAALAQITIDAPSAVIITSSVIDNNVLLKWTPSIGSFPIRYYQIRKGSTFETAEVIGTKDGLFTTIFEAASGSYRYWVVPLDINENPGAEASADVQVNQPPDYVLNVNWIDDWTGSTHTNLADDLTGAPLDGSTPFENVVGPINVTETFAEHFINNSWNTPQDQIDAGFSIFAEPSENSAQYVQKFDYGAILPATTINITQLIEQVTGTVGVQYTISTSDDDVSYDDNVGVTNLFASGFRYVKITIDLTSSGGNDIARLGPLNVRLDSKIRSDGGRAVVSVPASGVAITFNVDFVDIISLTATPFGTTAKYAIIDYTDVSNPTGFTAYLLDDNGDFTDGELGWAASGYA